MTPEDQATVLAVLETEVAKLGRPDASCRVYRESDWTDRDGETYPGRWLAAVRIGRGSSMYEFSIEADLILLDGTVDILRGELEEGSRKSPRAT
jgi:hypothetical protein